MAYLDLQHVAVDRARVMQEEAYRIHLRMGNRLGVVCDCVNLLTGALLYEPPRLSGEWYNIGVRFADDINDRHSKAQLHLAHGMLHLHSGESTVALTDIAEALRVLRASESRRLMLESLPLIAEVCARFGDDRMAAQVLGAMSHMGVGADRFAWYRGKRRARAVEKGINQRLGEGEFARFTMLGAYQSVEQTIEAVLDLIVRTQDEQAQGEKAVDEETPKEIPALTGRETEVLSLVAQGLSDKLIAETLRISPRTAMTHVSNIMAKMEVHSRSAASELGIRLGLVDPPREDVGTRL
jgi:DNA-binding CsgD family transcriptional regulator